MIICSLVYIPHGWPCFVACPSIFLLSFTETCCLLLSVSRTTRMICFGYLCYYGTSFRRLQFYPLLLAYGGKCSHKSITIGSTSLETVGSQELPHHLCNSALVHEGGNASGDPLVLLFPRGCVPQEGFQEFFGCWTLTYPTFEELSMEKGYRLDRDSCLCIWEANLFREEIQG